MKNIKIRGYHWFIMLAWLALSTLNSPLSTVCAQGTAFTYQGQLQNGGGPANGSYDLAFTLYNTNTGGTAIAGPVTNTATAVTNGLFTVLVDFGPGGFTGASNWLEIAVQTNGGSSFTTLAPRQQVTPTPYAITANNLAGLTVQQNADGAPNLIGGAGVNYVVGTVVGATIGGGGADDFEGTANSNSVTGDFGTVGGGYANTAGGISSTVAGGSQNTASGYDNTVAGGSGNSAIGAVQSTVGGGENNIASGHYGATVGGGYDNLSSGNYTTVPGGFENIASIAYSFAAGQQAQATNEGAFVWADSQDAPFTSLVNDSFNVRAQGGASFVTGSAGVTVFTGGGTVQLVSESDNVVPSMIISNNNAYSGHLRFRNYLEVQPNLTHTTAGGIDVRDTNGNATIMLNGANGNVTAASFTTEGAAAGDFYAGPGAGNSGITGQYNTAVGNSALLNDTTGGANTAVGAGTLVFNTSGYNNSAFGEDALAFNSTGSNNVACGLDTLALNSSGYDNTAEGENAMEFNTTGDANTAIGGNALYYNHTGYNNVAVGFEAIQDDDGDFDNVAVGVASFQVNAGYQNTGIGTYAFQTLTAGNGNIGLGYSAGKSLSSGTNNIYIGNLGKSSESGIIRIGTAGTQTATYLVGTVSVPVLTITGGSDLAEPFKISGADRPVPQGAVVVIDEANPGHLKLSNQAYDARVAGVVSGANGIHPGIQMQQQGLLEGGRDVALSGRVYVQAEAMHGAIKPGDLLTTSDIPGYAMKVTDHLRAQGAILGKAMTALKQGQGMVLVLVTLQ
jgi:hypothetical protein